MTPPPVPDRMTSLPQPFQGACPCCGHDATDMKRRLDDLVIAARNHWGAGSEPHNLIRDVSDAILRRPKAHAHLLTPESDNG